jgi:hypothetical protein
VALTTMGTLLLELSLTRVFSVVFYYHFAFLAISIALFGLGAGGVFSYVVAGWKTPLYTRLGRLSAANSLLVVLALVVILAQKTADGASLVLIYFTTALPFFVAGTIVSLAVSEAIRKVSRVYFFDLIGAAGGCLLLIPLLDLVGGLNTVLAAGVLFAVAAAIWHSMDGSIAGRAVCVALALALVAFLTYNTTAHVLEIQYAKDQKIAKGYEKWNSFSRVAIAPEKGSGAPTIFIDADASTTCPLAKNTICWSRGRLCPTQFVQAHARSSSAPAADGMWRGHGRPAAAILQVSRLIRSSPTRSCGADSRTYRAAFTCGPACTFSWRMAAVLSAGAATVTR